jgi:hypothetical protein
MRRLGGTHALLSANQVQTILNELNIMNFKMDGFLETPSTLTLKFMLHKTRRAQVKKNLQALAESGSLHIVKAQERQKLLKFSHAGANITSLLSCTSIVVYKL